MCPTVLCLRVVTVTGGPASAFDPKRTLTARLCYAIERVDFRRTCRGVGCPDKPQRKRRMRRVGWAGLSDTTEKRGGFALQIPENESTNRLAWSRLFSNITPYSEFAEGSPALAASETYAA